MAKLLIQKTPTPYETDTAQIYILGGSFCTIDSIDYQWLSRYCWRLSDGDYCKYAYRRVTIEGKTHIIKMHREIMNCPRYLSTHHIDRNPLNNCRSNLVNLTQSDHRFEHGKSR